MLGGKIGCSGFYSQKSQNSLFPRKIIGLSRTPVRPAMEDLRVLFQPDWEVRSIPLDRGGCPSFYVALENVKLFHSYSSNSLFVSFLTLYRCI